MAITDTSPTSSDAHVAAPARAARPSPAAGLAAVLGSGDHKTLGRLYIGTSLVFGIVAFALLAWFGLDAGKEAVTDRAFLNFTLGQLGLVFGLVLPLWVGLATLVVPLQVGASTIAFPRAAAAAYWSWTISAVLLGVSYLSSVNGGIGHPGDANGVALTYLAIAGLVAALLLGTVCVMTTVITLRPSGMGLDRVPLFSWAMLVAGSVWLLTLPALVGNAAFIFVQVKYGTAGDFSITDNQWAQLGWFLTPPQVFAYAIPVLGIVGDVVATAARGRLAARSVLLFAIGAFGVLSFGAYVQPAFNKAVYHQLPFVAQVVMIVLPVLLVLGVVAMTAKAGKLKLTAPFVLGVVALLLVLLGALAAVPFVVGPLDLQATNGQLLRTVPALKWPSNGVPVYTWGVFGIVIVASLAGAAAGLFHWGAKITGRLLPDALGKLLGLAFLGAALLFGAPYLALGFANKAEGLADGKALVVIPLAGALLAAGALAVSLLLTLGSRASVLNGGATAEADAWGAGQTLEWATASPPAPGNFGELPTITSAEPLLDLQDGGAR